MDADVHDLLQRFSQYLIQQDWEAAHTQLASFTQDRITHDALALWVDDAVQEVNEEYMLSADAWPGSVDLDGNSEFPLDSLRADPGEKSLPPRLPDEVTNDNYRGWYCISLMAHEEQDLAIPGWWDLWMAVVEEEWGMRIAYLELMEMD